MCGIAGVYRRRGSDDDRGTVESMLARLERRGPDDSGVEVETPVTLGNRRLAILDLTSAGHQPMRSPDGRWLVTFNGEIYNFDELRRELGLRRGQLRSRTDTEILLHAWDRWGIDALPRMVGQFAFAMYDRDARELWLARDRFGEKPLFYHHDEHRLSFASSVSALLASDSIVGELDRSALMEYVTLRYVVSPRTIVSGIAKLPGGHYLHVKDDRLRVARWYQPRFRTADLAARSRSTLVEEFDALLLQASRRCLVSDVPAALLLSDGIDSNSVRAVLSEHGQSVPSFTYTMTGQDGPPLDPPDAHSNGSGSAPVTPIVVTPRERIACMREAFASFTEPVGDGASLATWLLIRRAREHATVFLCGHGGDEVLGGYRLSQDRFRLSAMRGLAWLPEPMMRRTLDRFLYGSDSLADRRRRFRDAPPHLVPDAARYLIHRPLPHEDLVELFGSAGLPDEPYLETVDRLYAEQHSDDALDRMQGVMLATFLSENILSFADSVAMDSSAELRMPFLDRDLVDFVLSLPPSARVSQWPGRANTKLILRWWGKQHLPRSINRRRKRPFNFGTLPGLLTTFGDELRDIVLASAAIRTALPGIASWLRRPPDSYRGPWEGTLWALLALATWCEAVGID